MVGGNLISKWLILLGITRYTRLHTLCCHIDTGVISGYSLMPQWLILMWHQVTVWCQMIFLKMHQVKLLFWSKFENMPPFLFCSWPGLPHKLYFWIKHWCPYHVLVKKSFRFFKQNTSFRILGQSVRTKKKKWSVSRNFTTKHWCLEFENKTTVLEFWNKLVNVRILKQTSQF